MSRRFAPGVPDLVFGLVLASVLVGGRSRLLNDPGTLWHLRLGREILRTGDVPAVDTLTFTRAGAPWVDQSWLFDAGPGARWSTAAAGRPRSPRRRLGLAAVYGALARGLLRDGRSPLVALVVAVLAAGVGTIHFLVRPHLFTLGVRALTLRLCQAPARAGRPARLGRPAADGRSGRTSTADSSAGPLIVVDGGGSGTRSRGRWDAATARQARRRSRRPVVLCVLARRWSTLTGSGFTATSASCSCPSGVTDLIDEYQPIPFGKPDARVFEWVMLALVALPTVSRRPDRAATTWRTRSSGSTWPRLGPARPAVRPGGRAGPRPAPRRPAVAGRDGARSPTAWRRWSVWPALAALALGAGRGRRGSTFGGFDPAHWPLAALPGLDRAAAGDPRSSTSRTGAA